MVGDTDYAAGATQLRIVLDTFEELGLPVAMKKLEGPTSCLTFLGFEIDAVAMELRLPQSKLKELQKKIQGWKHKDSCLKKDMELLVGKLAHTCKVVRPFLRQLYQNLAQTSQPYHHIHFNVAV